LKLLFTSVISLIAVILFSIMTNAQSVVFSYNFDNLMNDQRLVCQDSANWRLWSLPPCDTIEGPVVSSNYAYSGTKSVLIVHNNDLVKTFGPYTTGKWETSWQMYIPVGKSGYFNTLHNFAGNSSIWAMQVFFNANAAGTIDAAGASAASFTYTQGSWISVKVIIDLDADQGQFWLEGQKIYQWQWSLGWNGGGGSLAVNANDFYGYASTDSMYVDNYTIKNLLNFSILYPAVNGWNLVSFPGIHPNSMLADTLFRFRQLSTPVYSFDSTGYHSEDTLKNGKGYWLKHSGPRTYNWNGTVQNGILYPYLHYTNVDSFNVSSGWNLIGAYEFECPVSGIVTNPTGLISGSFYSYQPGAGYAVEYSLKPGRGYWVYLSGAGKMIYPDRPSYPKNSNSEIISKNWARIIIKDAAGKQYTLYSSNGEGQSDKYLMPPKPPDDAFDVRFTTDKFVEDLTGEKTIEITGAEYPVVLRVEGMNIKIKDMSSGRVLSELDDGNEFVIYESAANRLAVSSGELWPAEYKLLQNYPNPFNPSTKIKYSIPDNEFVTLKIYDMLGEEKAVLVNSLQTTGYHEVVFNSALMASGIYFYKMTAGSFSSSKKMMILK